MFDCLSLQATGSSAKIDVTEPPRRFHLMNKPDAMDDSINNEGLRAHGLAGQSFAKNRLFDMILSDL